MSDVEHIMVTVLHHIAGDGWSLPILYEDLSKAYAKAVTGESARLEALPIQYADYAIRQRDIINRGGYAADLEFWTEQLEGAPDIIPLPTDRPRPAVLTSRGHRVRFTLRSAPTAAFWRIAKEETASGFMVGMAIYQAFLQHVTGVDDLVVGMPSADRSDADTQPLVGFLVNTLALRARVEPGLSLREWVRTVRRAALDAYDHREVPFEHVVRHLAPPRRTDRNPLFQLFYQFGTGAFAARPDFVGIDAEPVERITTSSKFDITLYLGHDDHTLTGSMVYNADLFDEPTIADLIHRLDEFAGRALARPDEPIELDQRTISQRTVSRRPIELERPGSGAASSGWMSALTATSSRWVGTLSWRSGCCLARSPSSGSASRSAHCSRIRRRAGSPPGCRPILQPRRPLRWKPSLRRRCRLRNVDCGFSIGWTPRRGTITPRGGCVSAGDCRCLRSNRHSTSSWNDMRCSAPVSSMRGGSPCRWSIHLVLSRSTSSTRPT